MADPVAIIQELWRYPVKGMRGEQVDTLPLDTTGAVGDRRFAIRSTGAPAGKPLLSSGERAAMLLWQARGEGDATEVIAPTDERFYVHDPALLQRMRELLPGSHNLSLVTSRRPLTDVRPLALLGDATVAELGRELSDCVDARRFRANIILSGLAAFDEDKLAGKRVRVGKDAVLQIRERTPRCRIVTLDPETAQADPLLMRHLARQHEGRIGVYATVVTPGTLQVGDTLRVTGDVGAPPSRS